MAGFCDKQQCFYALDLCKALKIRLPSHVCEVHI